MMMKWKMMALVAAFIPAFTCAQPYIAAGGGDSVARDADRTLGDAVDDLEGMGLTVTNSQVDDTDAVAMFAIGGNYSKSMMLEVAYANLGEFDFWGTADGFAFGGSTEARTVYASMLPYLQIGGARFYGRVGVGYWHAESKSSSVSASVSDNGWGRVTGAGMEYSLGGGWSARAEWTRHFGVGERDTTGESDIDAALIGVVLRN